VCDPPSFRRSAGIGWLFSSVGISVAMLILDKVEGLKKQKSP